MEGDFFPSVPAGGDVYVLKSVLHDWDDERCTAILQSCRAAMDQAARLAIIELLLPKRISPDDPMLQPIGHRPAPKTRPRTRDDRLRSPHAVARRSST